jgi:transglutaminase/protease-like cytokinesis protein 3
MANTKNSKKNVKRNKPTRKRYATESDKKIPDVKNKMQGESKQAMLIKLLGRPGGATIDEMAEVTGWQPHSIRGMMSGVLKKRLGFSIASSKEEHGRSYRIAA